MNKEHPSKDELSDLSVLYREALINDVVPFWEGNSPDEEYGGYFTCLDRDGSVFDTDKFVWLQARQVWTFSKLYLEVERRTEWLELAALGADFLSTHGRDSAGNWYFALDRPGQPLVQPYNIFSDCFAAMAFGTFALASNREEALDTCISTVQKIEQRMKYPKGPYEKQVRENRPLQNLALPMILANLAAELEDVLPDGATEARSWEPIHSVVDKFRDPNSGLLYENRLSNGAKVDCFEGRLINPGHGIETIWFLIDASTRLERPEWIQPAIASLLRTLEFAWDPEWGGLYYFLDADGHPPLQLEWDQKLWWVHLETLVALAMAYENTLDVNCWEWFKKVHDYSWTHFPDPDFGEWFGYLNRRGEVLLPLKGGKWKGFFHLPRALLHCWRVFERLQSIPADEV